MCSENKKITAFIFAVFFIIMSMTSLFYIQKEINHDCTGNDCPICICIHEAQQIIRNTAVIPSSYVFNILGTMLSVCIIGICFLYVIFMSLVSKKVRMDN